MANENERKHDPAENRQAEAGHPFDDAKTGGGERTVGLTGDQGGTPTGQGAGSGGQMGGQAGQQSPGGAQQSMGESSSDRHDPSADNQVLTGDQPGADTFSGQPQSGTSTLAANRSRDDLGASGAGAPDTGENDGGSSSDAFIAGKSDDSGDYLQKDGNPKGGFAEDGQGAPTGSGPEGTPDRSANDDSDVEGGSSR